MRPWLVVFVVACSHPPTSPHVPHASPADAAVADESDVAESGSATTPTPDPHFDQIGHGFEWDAMRHRQAQARADAKGQPPHSPCTAHPAGQICESSRVPLAARGRLVQSKPPLLTMELDVGSDDGVSEYYWAALLDSAGKPITKYQRVEAIRPRTCVVRLALENPVPDARLAVIYDPPADQKAPPL